MLFGQIHLYLFTVTVSTLLMGSKMLRNVQTGIFHCEILPVWVMLMKGLSLVLNLKLFIAYVFIQRISCNPFKINVIQI